MEASEPQNTAILAKLAKSRAASRREGERLRGTRLGVGFSVQGDAAAAAKQRQARVGKFGICGCVPVRCDEGRVYESACIRLSRDSQCITCRLDVILCLFHLSHHPSHRISRSLDYASHPPNGDRLLGGRAFSPRALQPNPFDLASIINIATEPFRASLLQPGPDRLHSGLTSRYIQHV